MRTLSLAIAAGVITVLAGTAIHAAQDFIFTAYPHR